MSNITTFNATEDASKAGEYIGLREGYIPFRNYYGVVLEDIDEECVDNIDESVYFRALTRLGVLTKGRLKKEAGRYVFIDDRDGVYLPADSLVATELAEMNIDPEMSGVDYHRLSYFITKRGTFGFDSTADELALLVKKPLLDMLCEFSKDIDKEREIFEQQKAALKDAGLPIGNLSWRDVKAKVINRHFG